MCYGKMFVRSTRSTRETRSVVDDCNGAYHEGSEQMDEMTERSKEERWNDFAPMVRNEETYSNVAEDLMWEREFLDNMGITVSESETKKLDDAISVISASQNVSKHVILAAVAALRINNERQ